MVDHRYETQVSFYQKYNYAATADIRKELVDQMNGIIDDLYENRYNELYHENAFRRVKGKQLTIPTKLLPKEMVDFILSMGRGYLSTSGLQLREIDPTTTNLEIQQIWATDSEETDYTPIHSQFGLMSGVFYLRVPPQVSELNEEGSFNLICPEATEWIPSKIKEPYVRRTFEQSLKIDTAGGPDAKLKGDRNLRGLADA